MRYLRTLLPAALLTWLCIASYAQVVIHEISYNPPESGTDSLEYIELFNAGALPINIGGWYFAAGIEDTLPDVELASGGYFVTAVSAQAMLNVFGIDAHQWIAGGLNNGGELLWLVDADGNLVDSVRFDDADPWPTEPDGNGPSLELIDVGADNNDGANWQFSGGNTGIIINGFEVSGTPGAENSGGGTPGPAVTIDMFNFAFHPPVVVVQVGDIVRWVNNDTEPHNVNGSQADFPGNPEGFFSGPATIGPWEFDHEFTIPGTYHYQCDPHIGFGMTGIVYVYDPLIYNDFPLSALRTTNLNGQALFDGVPTTVSGVVHGINFSPAGYSFYVINPDNVGINVFSFDPGSYVVQEGDQIEVSGVIDQFNGLLEIIPDAITVQATDQPLVSAFNLDIPLIEELEGSHVFLEDYIVDSVMATGSSGHNVFVTSSQGHAYLIRLDADLGVEVAAIEGGGSIRGVGTQFDNSFPFTEGYQLLVFEVYPPPGVEMLPEESIQMLPNPARDRVAFQSDLALETFHLYSLDGRLLRHRDMQRMGDQVSLTGLANGTYVVKISTAGGIWTSRLVIIE